MKFGVSVTIAALICSVSPAQDNPVFRGESQVVVVPTLVKDPDGRLIDALTAKDFVVEDDGVEQKIKLDETPTRSPRRSS